ncbi:PAS domain-containing protein [Sphingomonas sp. G-3-2-10]|uniref:PAS domain-containing protein n=1 Tax=Sphingomonas sp. G-3-2-10 TaxID=2728838 RepID=UPI00146CDE02|nr:PAS domain-containing protein [Sphingomonas sp. G-3-2-10]NML06379.1 PAS domain-containing protein [Sphingomonas sp. G-3-2-10]
MGSLFYPAPSVLTRHWIDSAGPETETPLQLPAAWRCDLADDSLTWSAGVFELFGIPQGARIDRRETVAMYCEESRELLHRLRSEAIATCGSFTFEARIRRPDGESRWMRVTADVVARGGRATHLYGMKQDITAEMSKA